MYVCNCNGIRERQVLLALENGASRACDVFQQNKCAAKCGRCVSEMQEFLDDRRQSFAMAAQ